MALIKENDLTDGMSGKFGNKIVFRVVKGVTVAARRTSKSPQNSEKQIAQQQRFQRASQYAKAKMLDPDAKAYYKALAGDKAFNTAFSAAVRDYLTDQKILSIDTNGFSGAVGSTIAVKVQDNAKTISMKVEIRLADDTLVETGNALLTPGDTEWKYVTTQSVTNLSGSKIIITAIDRPGNQVTRSVTLP
jgi:hypothetical protein